MRGLSHLHRCPDMSVFAGREFEPGPLSPSPVCALLRVIVIDVLCWVIPELMPDPRWVVVHWLVSIRRHHRGPSSRDRQAERSGKGDATKVLGGHAPGPAAGSYNVRMTPFLVSASLSSKNSRLTIRRMTSRGVKCSPAVSFEASEAPDEFLEDVAHLDVVHDIGMEVDLGELAEDKVRAVHCFKMPSLAKSRPTCDAFRRSASAMLVTPMVRSKPIVAFRKAAITSGPERLRIRLASSPIVTSRT